MINFKNKRFQKLLVWQLKGLLDLDKLIQHNKNRKINHENQIKLLERRYKKYFLDCNIRKIYDLLILNCFEMHSFFVAILCYILHSYSYAFKRLFNTRDIFKKEKDKGQSNFSSKIEGYYCFF